MNAYAGQFFYYIFMSCCKIIGKTEYITKKYGFYHYYDLKTVYYKAIF